ncbi:MULTISPECIES: hypothetical protein [unclassified Mycolicibacterium]|uniref:sunset domain-containing protein n=1 Tax=unclassified Mycolicibacterium TaxID=2636767 RepID=UPI001412E1FC|nr:MULTISPECIES: hypothetical protein [unclassified Mycolicibacterium]MUM07460.1 hypothetical protein [Mycolicibacterium sp. CBMA 213]
MTGLRTRAGRAGVGALSVAVALLMAPLAVATPEGDAADAAIGHAYDAAGGDGGALGAKDGDVYQVGGGYAQNFASGKIYFTAGAGAHPIYGAVLDKYQSLGGPADSDLGFPTIDEGAGKAPGSQNSTFSAADKPVIFWTPDNGAWVVRGAINAAWDKLGGSAGTLGVPTADESWKGDVVSQAFTGGEVSWNATTKAFTTAPADLAGQLTGLGVPGDATTAIAAARRAYGGPQGPLGDEQGAQYKVGDTGGGVAQNFAGGTIFYSPNTGAHVVTGELLAKYRAAGGPQGDLGFPNSNETDGGVTPTSRVATFAAADNPEIFWTPDHGAFVVRGAINAAWAKLGGATGKLGAPTGDQSVKDDVFSQKFTGGSISWNKSSKAFTTEPSDLASQLSGLQVPRTDLPNAASGQPAESGKWYQFHWWWLLAIIPLLLVAIGIAIAALLRRRRRNSQDDFDDYVHDDYGDDYGDYEDPQFAAGAAGAAGTEEGQGDEHGAWENGSEPWEPGVADEFAADVDHHDTPYAGPEFQGNPDVIDTAPTVYPDFNQVHPADEPDQHPAEGEPEAEGAVDASTEPEAEPEAGDRHDDEPTVSVQLPEALRRGGAAAGLGAAGLAGFAALGRREPGARVWAAPESSTDTDDRGAELVGGEPELAEATEPTEAPELAEASAPADAPESAADVEATPEADHMPPAPADQPTADHTPPDESVTAGPPSGRHHALGAEEPETAQMSFRVATDAEPPAGYDIKANTKTGLYWVPGSPGYDSAHVEIWFASEEFAVTNGFIRG